MSRFARGVRAQIKPQPVSHHVLPVQGERRISVSRNAQGLRAGRVACHGYLQSSWMVLAVLLEMLLVPVDMIAR